MKTLHAPSWHCRDARVYGHTTTAMQDNEFPPPPPSVVHKAAAVLQAESRVSRKGEFFTECHLQGRCTDKRNTVRHAPSVESGSRPRRVAVTPAGDEHTRTTTTNPSAPRQHIANALHSVYKSAAFSLAESCSDVTATQQATDKKSETAAALLSQLRLQHRIRYVPIRN